ncbi:MAG: error-prone DNA polymerase [Gammaproteobacteria bacterium]
MTLPDYAELHCVSNFTFLRGASHPEELVARAAALGYRALAVTDECSLAGVVRAHQAAKECGLHLIVGSELRLADGPALVLLAMDRDGYANLSELITRARRRAPKGQYELRRDDLETGVPGCLALLLPLPADESETLAEQADWLGARFAGRAWIAAELLRGPDDAAWLARLESVNERTGLPLAAAGGVHMHTRERRTLQDVLTAIRLGTPVQSLGKALCPNGERHLRTRKRLAHVYPAALLTETVRIAERCTFSLDELRYEYPTDDVPPGETATAYLRRLTEAGLAERWPAGAPENVRALVEHELAVIAELGYEPYFLTVYDIVRFARSRGILCQGRGSAANSVVCYCLGITAVDPSRMEMLFERFVSKERNEPPDIDVDFEHERREEVIQYIYSRYGRERAALTATVITYRPKSALRDVGKALGFDAEQVERLADSYAWWDGREQLAERVREAGLDPASPLVQRLIELVLTMLGFPRHLSQHVGGFVIARGAVSRLVPIENAAMAERSVIEWDKDDLDTMGLLKVDVLGLGMLSAIRRAFDLIARHRGRPLSLPDIPPEDPAVYAMLSHADTVGVFQIESRAQMAMLPRLKPRTFYDLVIEVAIVRPGPIQGEMVHPYLRRRDGLEPVSYPSEAVRRVLERTLGVPIFQEQVIKLAVVAAGFSPGEADALRRAIGSWRRRDKLERFRQKLVDGMRERGYSEDFAQQIYNQIQGFGEYGFPESHAASFALLVYVSAWLKRYEPAAFACALLNSQPMGFYAPSQLVQDARRHGVEVRPVDVAHSGWDYTLEPTDDKDLALRLGLRQVKGLSKAGVERLVEARAVQAFHSVTELTRRARLGRTDIDALAGAGALASLAGHRHHAHWQALGTETTLPLFGDTADSDDTDALRTPTEGEDLVADYSSLGLTLGRHPLALLRAELVRRRCASSATLRERAHDASIRIAGLVVTRQHPSSAKGVIFLTVEDETGSANVIVWPKLSERYRREVLNGRLLIIDGQVQREGEVIHVIARRLEDQSDLLGALPTQSRDFC